MKTTIKKGSDGFVCISAETLSRAGMGIVNELEFHISGSILVVTKPQITANELREATDKLMKLGREFSLRANEICAGCDGEDCPYLGDDGSD